MQIKKEAPSAVEAAMELTAVMAVSQIAQQEKKPETEVLKSFMNSNTAKMLFDDETKLWHNGPAYVAYEYLKECKRRKNRWDKASDHNVSQHCKKRRSQR